MNQNLKWRSFPVESYTTQEDDDDTIVYNSLSGETHQLNMMAVDALNFLQHPANLHALVEHICLLYQTDNVNEITLQMTRLIEQFDNIGLVEPHHT